MGFKNEPMTEQLLEIEGRNTNIQLIKDLKLK